MDQVKKFFILGLVFIFFSQPVLAQSETQALSLSDAIYADLALRHNLDNVSLDYDDGNQTNGVKLNEARHWLPASTVKTFAAMYAYKLISQNKLHLYEVTTIEAKNSVSTELVTEELPALNEGDSVTVDRLIRQMITQSDNTAFNVLLDLLGRDKITAYIQSLGLIYSKVGSKLNLDTSQEQDEFDEPGYGINTTTAEDYAKAFALIKNQKIPGAKELFAILKEQKINNMIPLYLPKDVVCGHKTGDLDPLYHDGGICQDQKQSYVLTIFTNAGDPKLLAHLSELLYTKNPDLVGQPLETKLQSQPMENQPLDPLVWEVPARTVLGASTTLTLPGQTITAADLGVTSNDLSLVINDKDLPPVFIPADSPWHILVDGLQLYQKTFTFNQKFKREIALADAKLHLAEANDLLKRGKTKDAQAVLQGIQPVLSGVIKETTIRDASEQNTIQQISETRFAILANALTKTKGDAKTVLLKNIAHQAKEMVQNVQPNLPGAANASNPTQRPLIGKVINSSSTDLKIKTSGGQEIIIPLHNNFIVIKDRKNQAASLAKLSAGTTVALIGSTTNNTFSPTFVLANIPRELAAPQPVTVAKVDLKHKTMVVVENGVYTQVNINQKTVIKAADTNIPLKEIKPGDTVVVHGQQFSAMPSPTPTPTGAAAPGVKQNATPVPGLTATPKALPQNQTEQTKPSAVTQTPPPPKIIESTTIKLLEKKKDVEKPPAAQPVSKPKSESSPAQSEHQPQTVPSSLPIKIKDEKKK